MRKLALVCFIVLICSCGKHPPRYNGYIDADMTYLSSNFAGRVTDLLVRRGQAVQKNQLLFKLEQTSENFAVTTSKFNKKNLVSQKNEIINQIQYTQSNYHRIARMRKQDAASQNDLEAAKKDLDVLNNQLKAIDFQIKSAVVGTKDKNWQAAQKENHATDAGIIFDTYFTEGEYAQAGQPVVSLITRQNIKVIFFVAETQLSSFHLNNKIQISVDGNQKFATGTINYISNTAQYTPPIIYSREDRKSLIFRVEAQIDSPDLNHIHLGLPVTVEFVS